MVSQPMQPQWAFVSKMWPWHNRRVLAWVTCETTSWITSAQHEAPKRSKNWVWTFWKMLLVDLVGGLEHFFWRGYIIISSRLDPNQMVWGASGCTRQGLWKGLVSLGFGPDFGPWSTLGTSWSPKRLPAIQRKSLQLWSHRLWPVDRPRDPTFVKEMFAAFSASIVAICKLQTRGWLKEIQAFSGEHPFIACWTQRQKTIFQTSSIHGETAHIYINTSILCSNL